MKRFLLMVIVISVLVNVQTVEPLENGKRSGSSVFTQEEKKYIERSGSSLEGAETLIEQGFSKEDIFNTADEIAKEKLVGALPSSCICTKPTLMLTPSGSEWAVMGQIHHCKCGKLDCVRHRSGREKDGDFNLFCEEVGHFSKENTQPCVCSKPLVLKAPNGVAYPTVGIMHHCKCGEITCATNFVQDRSKISCSRARLFK